jgi:hypothetical protein
MGRKTTYSRKKQYLSDAALIRLNGSKSFNSGSKSKPDWQNLTSTHSVAMLNFPE